MDLVEHLDDHDVVTWRRNDDVMECESGSDLLARVGPVEALLGDQVLRFEERREHVAVVDMGTDGRMATIRRRAHGPTVVEVGTGRYRITRDGLKFWSRVVTEGVGGDPVMQALRIGSTIRVTITAPDRLHARDAAVLQMALVHGWIHGDSVAVDRAA